MGDLSRRRPHSEHHGVPRSRLLRYAGGLVIAGVALAAYRSVKTASSASSGIKKEAYYSREATGRLWGLVDENPPKEPLPSVAACARVRNEARYLREWIEFHKLVGVTSFYFFDDDSSDETRKILAEYTEYVWPIVSRCSGDEDVCADRTRDSEHGELGFRDECLRKNPAGADWILMTDVDEFIFPSVGSNIAEHLALNCDARVAYVLVRWHVFGSGGHRRRPTGNTLASYRERGREDDTGCYPRLTCGDDKAPPICAKVLARPSCVKRQGTHYVVKTSSRCVDIYSGERKMSAVDADSPFAVQQHEQCAMPLHLNHYAVRSREDYVEKFERGRISSEARDLSKGFAEKTESGKITRQLPPKVVRDFLDADSLVAASNKKKTATSAASRVELMLVEFRRRDHSEVLDESILRFEPALRRALGGRTETGNEEGLPSLMTWACGETSLNMSAATREASRAWRDTAVAMKKSHALFVHIPKTGGTTTNLVLGYAARLERKKFCILSFRDLDSSKQRRAAAIRCDLLSAETDVSVLHSLGKPRVALVTVLREPLARVASQYEHHISQSRLLVGHNSYGDIVKVVSPHLCSQLERDAQCNGLAHPRKCRAGGWCSIFQNHQTHVVAGAQHLSKEASAAVRRSSANLLCAARKALAALPVVGVTEQLNPSFCLLFDALGYSTAFRDCCLQKGDHHRHHKCPLFDLRATKYSAADRATSRSSFSSKKPTTSTNATTSYLSKYFDDDVLLAAIYEGNSLDCTLYSDAVRGSFHRSPHLSLFAQVDLVSERIEVSRDCVDLQES